MPLIAILTYRLLDTPRVRRFLTRIPLDDRGEGVISAAIAVLIMAFLGAAMWVGFDAIWGTTEANIGGQVEQIGR